jgi:hypothetical protein
LADVVKVAGQLDRLCGHLLKRAGTDPSDQWEFDNWHARLASLTPGGAQ